MTGESVDTKNWVRRNSRGAAVVGGLVVLTAVVLSSRQDAPLKPNHSIGVACADPKAEVSASQSGGTVFFECFDADGRNIAIDRLANLRTDHSPAAKLGYNDIIDFTAEGDRTMFNLDCGNYLATVTISHTLQQADYEPNSATAGVGCASNTNSYNGGIHVSTTN